VKVPRKLADAYTDFHWGAAPSKVYDIRDSLIPHVVQIGELKELQIPHGVTFPPGCHIAWDPQDPRTRLYVVLSPSMREVVRSGMKKKRTLPLPVIARAAGGKHARGWPNIQAHPLGEAHFVIYETLKVGDGKSNYIHRFAEEHGARPVLAADVSGRLWLVGGDYRVTNAGIEN
jgi:hypothetical protein